MTYKLGINQNSVTAEAKDQLKHVTPITASHVNAIKRLVIPSNGVRRTRETGAKV